MTAGKYDDLPKEITPGKSTLEQKVDMFSKQLQVEAAALENVLKNKANPWWLADQYEVKMETLRSIANTLHSFIS
jgi:hypothetical protein